MTAIPKPTRADRVVSAAQRRDRRRSAPAPNLTGAALPRPEVWRCAAYVAAAKKRWGCAIKGRNGHVCGPRVNGKVHVEFAHAEPAGRGLKSSDYFGVVLCADAHMLQTRTSWGEFQERFGFDRQAEARRIFESSPWAKTVEVPSW